MIRRTGQSKLSPASRLPRETIDQIFSCVVFPGSQTGSSRFVPGPWGLGWICGQWRQILLDSPDLWSDIHVTCPNHRKDSVSFALDEVLARSQDKSLAVSFRVPLIEEHDMYFTRHLFLKLLEHAHRWKKVDLALGRDTLKQLASVRGRVPSLEELSIELKDTNAGGAFDMFDVSPSLYSVHLLNFPSSMALVLPWNQIKSFHFFDSSEMTSPSSFEGILQMLPNVEHFVYESFSGWIDLVGHMVSHPTLVVPHLKFLQVSHTQPARYIQLPSLVGLNVNGTNRDMDFVLGSLRDLISRSSCSLTHLTLSGKKVGCSPNFGQLLDCVPDLKFLSLTDHSTRFEHILFPFLELGTSSAPVIPYLRVLRIESSSFKVNDVGSLTSMIVSRRDCLEDVELVLHFNRPTPSNEASMNFALEELQFVGGEHNIQVVVHQDIRRRLPVFGPGVRW